MTSGSIRGPAVWLGYDPSLLVRMNRTERRDLETLAQSWIFSCALLSFPLGLVAWLVEHSLLVAISASCATFIMVLNLLRLITAGSGVGPEQRLVSGYRPSLWPGILVAGLALLMSQPAQLLHAAPSVHQAIEAHRAELIESHLLAQRGLRASFEQTSGARDFFLAELERCEFVVLRLKLLWSSPQSAVLWTALYVGLVLSPAVLSRLLWSDTTFAYERLRHDRSRLQLQRLNREADQAVYGLLSAYPSYRKPWGWSLSPAKLCRPRVHGAPVVSRGNPA